MKNGSNSIGKAGAAKALASAASEIAKHQTGLVQAHYDLIQPVERGAWRATLVTPTTQIPDLGHVRVLAETLSRDQLVELVVLLAKGTKLSNTVLSEALITVEKAPYVRITCTDKVVSGQVTALARERAEEFVKEV